MRRADSDSEPSPRAPHSESISSMNTMAGLFSRAMSNSVFTSRSDSPCHLDTRSEEETEKKVPFASVATALARYDLPVPGGPYSRMPFHGLRLPTNSCGNLMGRMTASFSASLAPSSPATSSHFTLGFSVTMAPASDPFSLDASPSSPPPLPPPPPSPRDAVAAPPAPPCASPRFESSSLCSCSARAMYCPARSSTIFFRVTSLSTARGVWVCDGAGWRVADGEGHTHSTSQQQRKNAHCKPMVKRSTARMYRSSALA